MICFPNAKINLGLNIVDKRPDGFHNIETIFYPIPVKDALEVTASDTFSFTQLGLELGIPGCSNLVVKTVDRLRKEYTISPIDLHLLKKIPFGAGLGGGSADAAFTLTLLNDFLKLNIPVDELERIASTIGADCAFFIRNKPVFAKGIGNEFDPINLSLKGYHLCLVKPNEEVSTKDAYAMVTPSAPDCSLKKIIEMPVSSWKGTMINDFEASVFHKYPSIGNIKKALYEEGAVYASMSGSGSCVFGLFNDPVSVSGLFPRYYVWEGSLD